MRLIDADAIVFTHAIARSIDDGHNWNELCVTKDEIDDLPSAEPERKTGKWEVQPSTGDDRPFIWWKCSECGHVIFSETERDRREFHAFCGRCGADMRHEDIPMEYFENGGI